MIRLGVWANHQDKFYLVEEVEDVEDEIEEMHVFDIHRYLHADGKFHSLAYDGGWFKTGPAVLEALKKANLSLCMKDLVILAKHGY